MQQLDVFIGGLQTRNSTPIWHQRLIIEQDLQMSQSATQALSPALSRLYHASPDFVLFKIYNVTSTSLMAFIAS